MRAIVVAAALTAAVAACSTSERPDRSIERSNCANVGRLLGASPQAKATWVRKVENLQPSANAMLDGAIRRLSNDLRGDDSDEINRAFSQVIKICDKLGLWRAYH